MYLNGEKDTTANDIDTINVSFNILTSTKNASLIISDFLAMLYKNEQPLWLIYVNSGRGWKMTSIYYAGDALF